MEVKLSPKLHPSYGLACEIWQGRHMLVLGTWLVVRMKKRCICYSQSGLHVKHFNSYDGAKEYIDGH